MGTYVVEIEVPDDTTPEQLHEDLCQTLHEDSPPGLSYINIGFPEYVTGEQT